MRPAAADVDDATEVGSYFVTNYPPYSQWRPEDVPEIDAAFAEEPDRTVPLGWYIHLPYCRKRCRFCYFRVYTHPTAAAIERYLSALIREAELLSRQPALAERPAGFVYYGGGTPSYLSVTQLRRLHESLAATGAWGAAEEISFECEPGTLSQAKVAALKDLGVTRISLGIENFDDTILAENGRAHDSADVYRAYEWIRAAGFAKVNVDLIAGMLGETDENWRKCIAEVRRLDADSVTIYQLELPFNTLISQELRAGGGETPLATWGTKRRWLNAAIDELLAAGYQLATANELVKRPESGGAYREHLFHGSDILGLGVSAFGHLQGVHYQNWDGVDAYQQAVESGRLPIHRALRPTAHQRLIREFVLTLKTGRVSPEFFRQKHGVDVLAEFAAPLSQHAAEGYLTVSPAGIELTRRGLLQVDRLLAAYFEPQHRGIRYT